MGGLIYVGKLVLYGSDLLRGLRSHVQDIHNLQGIHGILTKFLGLVSGTVANFRRHKPTCPLSSSQASPDQYSSSHLATKEAHLRHRLTNTLRLTLPQKRLTSGIALPMLFISPCRERGSPQASPALCSLFHLAAKEAHLKHRLTNTLRLTLPQKRLTSGIALPMLFISPCRTRGSSQASPAQCSLSHLATKEAHLRHRLPYTLCPTLPQIRLASGIACPTLFVSPCRKRGSSQASPALYPLSHLAAKEALLRLRLTNTLRLTLPQKRLIPGIACSIPFVPPCRK